VGAYSKGQLLAYDKIKMAVVDERSLLSGWRDEGLKTGMAKGREEGMAKGREEGLVKGREEGMAKGIEIGMAKGIETGREEGEAKATAGIAVHALKKGMSPEDVSEFTGLPLNEIHKLKDGL
jgi:flagellar biosynthesis/type III secretory pathway protein FliH